MSNCKDVIPGTFIACGEGDNYCSQECLERLKVLKDGPEGGYETLEVIVSAEGPKDARERVRDALQKLLQDEIDGEVARDRGPGSY